MVAGAVGAGLVIILLINSVKGAVGELRIML
jgi:hypothetical protein